jgi:hypothetical protein
MEILIAVLSDGIARRALATSGCSVFRREKELEKQQTEQQAADAKRRKTPMPRRRGSSS